MKKVVLIFILFAFTFLLSNEVAAQTKIRVKFSKGSASKTIKGTVTGYSYKDYIVGASAGQTLTASIKANTESTVLVVFLPNGDNLEGATESEDVSGELPVSGNYVIRVMMMRYQARRKGSISNYTLKISIK